MVVACSNCGNWSGGGIICEDCKDSLERAALETRIAKLEKRIKAIDGTYIFTGTLPANLHDQFSGKLLCIILPGEESAPVLRAGVAAHFRVISNGECIQQGSIGLAGCNMNICSISMQEESVFVLPRSLNPNDPANWIKTLEGVI